jgi:hypothetical protein
MDKSARETNRGSLHWFLASERLKFTRFEISQSTSIIIVALSFIQNILALMYILPKQTLESFQKYLLIVNLSQTIKTLDLANSEWLVFALNIVIVLIPVIFVTSWLVKRAKKQGFESPNLYEAISQGGISFGLYNCIFIFLLLHPFLETNLIFIFCIGSLTPPDPRNKNYFQILNYDSCASTNKFGLIALFIFAVSICVWYLYVIVLYVFPRQPSTSHNLTNENKHLDIILAIKKTVLSFFIVFEIRGLVAFKYVLIIISFVCNGFFLRSLFRQFSFYNRNVFRATTILTMTEIIFGLYLTVQSVLLEMGFLLQIDLPYVGLVLFAGILCSMATLNYHDNRMLSSLSMGSDAGFYILKCSSMYYSLKSVASPLKIISRLKANVMTDKIIASLVTHFMKCQKTSCVCFKIKRKETIYDYTELKQIEFGEDSSGPDGAITVTSKMFYIKYFFLERLQELHALHPENIVILFSIMKFEVYEMKNFASALRILENLEFRISSTSDKFELLYMKLFLMEHYDFSCNHRITNRANINLEKFAKIHNSIVQVEQTIFRALHAFYRLISTLVG